MSRGGRIYEEPGPSSEIICKWIFFHPGQFYQHHVLFFSSKGRGGFSLLVHGERTPILASERYMQQSSGFVPPPPSSVEAFPTSIHFPSQMKTQAVQRTGRMVY